MLAMLTPKEPFLGPAYVHCHYRHMLVEQLLKSSVNHRQTKICVWHERHGLSFSNDSKSFLCILRCPCEIIVTQAPEADG